VVFTISAYAPEGRLGGLMFSGPRYSHVVGAGASFVGNAFALNDMGSIFMPGGPYGSRPEASIGGPEASGVWQMPASFALGPGKETAAIFINETRPLMWDFSTKPWTVSLTGPLNPRGTVGFFVITGEDFPEVRRKFMELIGRAPVPPLSVHSPFIVDTKNITDETTIINNAKEFRSLFPFQPRFGYKLTVNPSSQLFKDAKELGVSLLVNESPYVKIDSQEFTELKSHNYLVRNGSESGSPIVLDYGGSASSLIDYTYDAAADAWHASYRRNYILNDGAQYFFLSGGEPELYSSVGWYRGTSDPGFHSHYTWANRFTIKWLESIIVASDKQPRFPLEGPRKFMLTRAPFGTIGRFGAGLYSTGPTALFFGVVESQARAHANLLGMDYFTSDATPLYLDILAQSGGQPMVQSTLSLFETWAARNFMTNIPFLIPDVFLREPWIENLISIRRTFEPYYYSLSHRASRYGEPILSPLIYYFQEDERARDSVFETMLGEFILIGGGNLRRDNNQRADVYLPEGRWYDYFNRKVLLQKEGGTVELDTKSEGYYVTPILFKEGAIIPSWEDDPGSSSQASLSSQQRLSIKVFPGDSPSSFSLYEDDGNTMLTSFSRVQTTRLELSPKNQKGEITFTIKARENPLPGSPRTRSYLIEVHGVGNVKYAVLDGVQDNRVDNPQKLLSLSSGYYARGTSVTELPASETLMELASGELLFKTPPLDLSQDHTLVITQE
jgi:alpha-glucosidase